LTPLVRIVSLSGNRASFSHADRLGRHQRHTRAFLASRALCIENDVSALDERADADVSWATVEASPANAEPVSAHAPGDILADKYRLERPIAAGGQATVWEARHLALDARVAVKLVHGDVADEAQAARLFREARAVASLGHPAVVRVFDLAKTDAGEWFIVMELLEGKSLLQEIEARRRLPAAEAVQLILPVVEALAGAHAQGIVHRDVKPDNIILTRSGAAIQPKLLDFGVAKLRHHDGGNWQTIAGTVLGTPAYLSPEQAEGRSDVDHRTDIWSACTTLYEAVTGRLPFGGDTDADLFHQIAEQAPISIVEQAAGDAELWAIVRRGLEKARDDRWPSMHLFGEALARWLVKHGITRDASGASLEVRWQLTLPGTQSVLPPPRAQAVESTRPPPPPVDANRRRYALPLAVVAVMIVVLLLGTALLRQDAEPRRNVGPATTPPTDTPTATPSPPRAPAAASPALVTPAVPKTASPPRPSVVPAEPLSQTAPSGSAPVPQKRKNEANSGDLRPPRDLSERGGLDLLSPYR
jgi:serine/threonine protein kinase